MNNLWSGLAEEYLETLRQFLAQREEAVLHAAYELGRRASKQGLGVLDMARLHKFACQRLLSDPEWRGRPAELLAGEEAFYLESLSPFEATQRGFREANEQMRDLIGRLEEQNAKLAQANQDLHREIAERKRTEEMLRRYEAIVNTSRDFMTLINDQHIYVAANDAYCQAVGERREEVLGQSVAAVWGQQVYEQTLKQHLEQCFGGQETHYEAWFEVPAIGRHCFNVSYYPYWAQGKVTHAIVVTNDITEHKLAVEKSLRSESMLAEAQHVAQMGSWDWNVLTDAVSWSEEFYRIHGLKPTEFVGTFSAFLHSIHPQDRRRVKELLAGAVRHGRPIDLYHRIVRTDGQERTLHVQGRVVTDKDGQTVRVHGTGQDVTEFKRAQEALRQSEERFRLLVSSVRDYAIFQLSADGRVVSWNGGAERVEGYHAEEIIGRHIDCFYPPEEVAAGKPNRLLRTALRRGRCEDEGWRVRKDGSRYWANTVITPIRDQAGKRHGFAKVTRDMTERKQAEEALRESEEHYRQLFQEARAMQESLRNLSNRILHVQEEERKHLSRELHDEVGQALTAINVNLAVLNRDEPVRPEVMQQRLADARHLLEQTIETVHCFARELRPSMLDDLGLLPALRSYVAAFGNRHGIQVRLRASEGVEQLDNEKKTVLYRVAQESLTNVAKHAHASEVAVSLLHLDDHVRMEIRDNGQAFEIDPHLILKGKKRLGLLGMQERVRLLNGQFAIESVRGKGTTVRVEIPVLLPESAAPVSAEPAAAVRSLPASWAAPALTNPVNRKNPYVENQRLISR